MTNLARSAWLASSVAIMPALGHAQPVKIGVISDMSGPYADNVGPGQVLAVRMAVTDFGATVLGRPIEVTAADDQNNSNTGVAIIRRWLDVDGVNALVEGSISSITLAAATLVHDKDRVLLISGSGSEELTGKACTTTSFQFTYDTYSLPKAVVARSVADGLKTWFVIGVDYAYGRSLLDSTKRFVEQAGGKVVGSSLFPLNSGDFSSYLLAAQASGAQAVALATGGSDWINLAKQAQEFGLSRNGQTVISLATGSPDVTAAGLTAVGGMLLATPFYWDANDATRAWSRRFMAANQGRAPTFQQAGSYSATLHYLKAVQAAGTTDGSKVAASMRAMPVDDFEIKNAPIRVDGQVMRPMYLARVKMPAASKGVTDIYDIIGDIPADQAWKPLAEGGCKLEPPN
jgi:branched-chain amino acid transport system substrate-binding protein